MCEYVDFGHYLNQGQTLKGKRGSRFLETEEIRIKNDGVTTALAVRAVR